MRISDWSSDVCSSDLPFAGFVTLSVATVGFYGKLLAEDIEDMDPVQAEAVRATGAGWLQWLNYAVQPQVMPRMVGLGLYRFDINFRESAVVGIVGGGGIRSEEHTSELQSLMRISYAVFCLKK